MALDLVCIGHVLYDIRCYVEDFPSPDKSVMIKGHFEHSGGGSAANAAVGASRLGLKSGVIGKIGFDEYGWFIAQNFRQHGVNVDHLLIDFEKPTGVSLVVINKDGIPEIVEMPGASEPVLSTEIRPDYVEKSRHLHMTGTNIEALETASRIAKESGKTISFDPGRSKSRLGYKRLMPILKNVDTLFVNRSEARALVGKASNTDIFKVVERLRWLVGEDKTYVVKGGHEDILVYSSTGTFAVSTFPVKVVDTIGAGDAFDIGVLTGLFRGKSLDDAVVYGTACGSLKCTREGAQAAPDKEELERFIEERADEVRVNKLP